MLHGPSLYRGKLAKGGYVYKSKGDWIYGLYDEDRSSIVNPTSGTGELVDSVTVGGWCGLEINARKIFSGDVIQYEGNGQVFICIYSHPTMSYEFITDGPTTFASKQELLQLVWGKKIKVIGDIYTLIPAKGKLADKVRKIIGKADSLHMLRDGFIEKLIAKSEK
jgi:hypothetical protein